MGTASSMARIVSSGSAKRPGRRAASDGACCDTCTSLICCADSGRHASSRCSSCTLPRESASVRGSAETSLSAGRASKSVISASGRALAACKAKTRPTGPAPITASCNGVDSFMREHPFRGLFFRGPAYYSPHPNIRVTLGRNAAMALMDFIKKQFIDIIEWTEDGDGVLAWRFPMEDREIQNGGSLTVRESQMAVFVNEGKVADVFGPGRYTLTTATLPILTYLQNWDKLFKSPFKSDVYFFSTRQQIDQRWGTTQPVTIRDKDFGAVRLRAFGNYSYRINDPKLFHTEISGTRDAYTVADLDGQLRGLMLQHISDAVASSGVAFLDLAANQVAFAKALLDATAPAFEKLGLKLEMVTMQNVSLPEELQKILDQKIGMGMVGDTARFMQYQTAQSIPALAAGAGSGGGAGVIGSAVGLGAGVALGQVMASQLGQGLNAAAPGAPAAAAAAGAVSVKSEDVMATLEKLADLKAKGIVTPEEFDAKKVELLKKLS